jgi:photosystem II stability/assembly factor-like uncharacterized protein
MYDSLNPQSPITTPSVCLSPEFFSDRSIFAGAIGGVLRSTNGGQDWNMVILPNPPPTITNLIISPNFKRDGVLLAGTLEDGILRSNDRGQRWAAWNFGLLDLRILSMVISPGFAEDETIYVGTELGIYRSTNGGRAWREVILPIENAVIICLAVSPAYQKDGTLLAGTESGDLVLSEDIGDTWRQLQIPTTDSPINAILLSQEFPLNPEIMILTADGIFFSENLDRAWKSRYLGVDFNMGSSCISAPLGLKEDAPVLIGLGDGTILRLN